jgi:uncharacterized protein YbgA (DUF1722 family)
MALSENQKKRLKELKDYVTKVKNHENDDFIKGYRSIMVNIGAWIILIEKDQ